MIHTTGSHEGAASRLIRTAIEWVAVSVLSAALVAPLVHGFTSLLTGAADLLSGLPVPLPLLTLLGALVAAGVVYRLRGHVPVEPVASYIRHLGREPTDMPLSATTCVLSASFVALASGSSGGIVGPLGRVAAGATSAAARGLRRLGLPEWDRRTAAVCGMAAAVGAIFGAPVGGGVFALEVLPGNRIDHRRIVPAILASSTAALLSSLAGWESLYSAPPPSGWMEPCTLPWLAGLSLVAGFAGLLYVRFYSALAGLLRRGRGRTLLKAAIGSLAAATVAWLVSPELLGPSFPLASSLVEGNLSGISSGVATAWPLWAALLLFLATKAVTNCLAVASGMTVGFTGPLVMVGILLGAATGALAPAIPSAASSAALRAAGMAGVLASSMNIPVTGAILAAEIFGLPAGLAAIPAAVAGFLIARRWTIYDYALRREGLSPDDAPSGA